MSNPANTGTLIGRLSQSIKEFTNSDGSRKLLINIAVDDNFRSGPDRKAQTNFIQVEHFVPAGGQAYGWDRVHKGDLIALAFRVDAKPYTRDGQTLYPLKLVVEGFPTFLEPKSVTDKRAAENAAKTAQAAAPEQTPVEKSAEERIAELEAERDLLLAQTQEPAGSVGAVAQAGVNYEDTPPF